jgi:uncharacterized protein
MSKEVNEIFADSFYFLALQNRNDLAHEIAVEASMKIAAPIVVTEWVLTEVADAFSSPTARIKFISAFDDIVSDRNFKIVESSTKLFQRGMTLYRNRPDKDWSLTDCISFVVMKERKIKDALTGDRHFEQAGFRALLK